MPFKGISNLNSLNCNFMKHLLTLIFTIAFSLSSMALKVLTPIEALIYEAELIVVGEIEEFNDYNYLFKINQTIKGQSSKEIRVNMFYEWGCDIRSIKPEKGQKLMLFLEKKGESFEIINGSSGERFIKNGSIEHTLTRKMLNVEELGKAIKVCFKAYKLKIKVYDLLEDYIFIQLKPNEEVEDLERTSELTRWLFGEIKSHQIVLID